jgi:hypothetical protein
MVELGAGAGGTRWSSTIVPRFVDLWHQGETRRFDRERTISLKARCTEREKCFRLVVVFAAAIRRLVLRVARVPVDRPERSRQVMS